MFPTLARAALHRAHSTHPPGAARQPPGGALDFYETTAREWEADLRELRQRLLGALAFMVAVTLLGTVGFWIIDPDSGLVRSFFMTAITLTTVGYGHEVDLETSGDFIFTAVLILLGMGGVLYFVSTATAFVIEGQLGHVFRRRRMEKELATLSNHLIVCGSGRTAVYVANELTSVQREVVMVVDKPEDATHVRGEIGTGPRIVVGDPTNDDVLMSAGVDRAAGIVACTGSDHRNLVVTLAARQHNPGIRIVSAVDDVDTESKVRRVGADAVVSPYFIGGLRMASELIRPAVVNFLDIMLRDRDMNLRIDEIRIPDTSPAVGKPLNSLGLDRVPGLLLLALRDHSGSWEYNPPRSDNVAPGMVLIFMGRPEDARQLCEQVGGEMIAAPTAAS